MQHTKIRAEMADARSSLSEGGRDMHSAAHVFGGDPWEDSNAPHASESVGDVFERSSLDSEENGASQDGLDDE